MFVLVEHGPAGLREITSLVESGRLRGFVDRVLPVDEAARAHALG